MTEGFTVFGAKSSDLTGWSVSSAGDVNNDKFSDIIIGAPGAGNANAGAAYVLYGKASGFRNIELSALSIEDGFTVTGGSAQDNLGLSVSGAGDVNGDGLGDIIVGALRQNAFDSGSAYILYGSADRTADPDHVYMLSAHLDVTITGPPWSWFGFSVSNAGDVNADGFDDVVIGSWPHQPTVVEPRSFILFGNASLPTLMSAESVSKSHMTAFTGGGVLVRDVGDINGDTFDDVLIIGSDVLLTTGGGIVVYAPTKIQPTNAPTHSPSLSPSWLPTAAPSFQPTSCPTKPTVHPTVAPSGPSQHPTLMPSQPTSLPSAQPTAPTVRPTLIPSTQPARLPTFIVTHVPTPSPPTAKPTVVTPTRNPVFRPTVAPTRFPKISYAVVYVNDSGTHVHIRSELVRTHYIINMTAPVDVVFADHGNGDLFTLIPNANTQAAIVSFSISCDVLDLRAFADIHSVEQLIVAEYNNTLTVHFPNNQKLKLMNATEKDFDGAYIMFATLDSISSVDRNGNGNDIIIVIVSTSLAALFVAFLLYKGVWLLVEYSRSKQAKVKPYSWKEMAKSNRTFVTFTQQDWNYENGSSSYSSSNSNSNSSSSGNKTSGVGSVVVSSLRSSDLKSGSAASEETKSVESGHCQSNRTHPYMQLDDTVMGDHDTHVHYDWHESVVNRYMRTVSDFSGHSVEDTIISKCESGSLKCPRTPTVDDTNRVESSSSSSSSSSSGDRETLTKSSKAASVAGDESHNPMECTNEPPCPSEFSDFSVDSSDTVDSDTVDVEGAGCEYDCSGQLIRTLSSTERDGSTPGTTQQNNNRSLASGVDDDDGGGDDDGDSDGSSSLMHSDSVDSSYDIDAEDVDDDDGMSSNFTVSSQGYSLE